MARKYEFKERGKRLSNWGRWGEDDEIGTLNFITDEHRVAAAGLVRRGRVFELSMALGSTGPQAGGAGRFNPIHHMSLTPADYDMPDGLIASDDIIIMPLQAATQWDALSHIGYDGQLYNGVPGSAVNNLTGASRNAIDKVADRLATRGVLLDIARLKGVERMSAGEEITADDLDAAERRQGVRVGTGDVLLVRTGWYRYFLDGDSATFMGDEPGIGASCCDWLHAREVAAAAVDNWAFEVRPSLEEGVKLPVHTVLIRDVGFTIGEMFNLEQLSEDCEQDGVWEFFFCAPPLKITGAVGSPITPLAIK